jgi:hypothetical protein
MRTWWTMFQQLPLDDEEAALEEIAQRVVREGLGSAFIVLLESAKPMGFLTGQAAIAVTPLLGGFIDPLRLERFAAFLSDRHFLERLIRRIEELESGRGGEAPARLEPEG